MTVKIYRIWTLGVCFSLFCRMTPGSSLCFAVERDFSCFAIAYFLHSLPCQSHLPLSPKKTSPWLRVERAAANSCHLLSPSLLAALLKSWVLFPDFLLLEVLPLLGCSCANVVSQMGSLDCESCCLKINCKVNFSFFFSLGYCAGALCCAILIFNQANTALFSSVGFCKLWRGLRTILNMIPH